MGLPKEISEYLEANTKPRMEQVLNLMEEYCIEHKISMGELLKLINNEEDNQV